MGLGVALPESSPPNACFLSEFLCASASNFNRYSYIKVRTKFQGKFEVVAMALLQSEKRR